MFLQFQNLFVLYHIYIVPTFVLSRITQLAIPYMLILTTLERLVLVSGHRSKKFLKQMFSDRGHHVTIFLLLLSCTILRLPTAFAIVVRHFICLNHNHANDINKNQWTEQHWLNADLIGFSFNYFFQLIVNELATLWSVILANKQSINYNFCQSKDFHLIIPTVASNQYLGSDIPCFLTIPYYPFWVENFRRDIFHYIFQTLK